MSSIQNPDDANAALEQLQENRRIEAEREAEYAATKQRLEQKRDQQTRLIDVLDEPVEFRPAGAGVAKRAMTLRRRATEGNPEAEEKLVNYVFQTLAEHSKDEGMDQEFWESFSMDVVRETFSELVMNDLDIDEEDIEQFR